LRRARAAHGQSVRAIAQVLRIRQGYIEALESGAFDQLPGTTYALGFLRTYAEYLGLDGNEMVDRFKAEVGGAEQRTELVFPEPVVEGRIPGGAVILISVALLGAAYGGWFYLSNQGRSVSDLIPAMPSQLRALVEPTQEPPVESAPVRDAAALVVEAPAHEAAPETAPAPAPRVAAEATEPAPAPQVAATPLVVEAPAPEATLEAAPEPEIVAAPEPEPEPQVVAAPEPTPQVAAVPVAAQPTPRLEAPAVAASPPYGEETVVIPAPPQAFNMPANQAPRIYGNDKRDARIVVRAKQDSWVQVRDAQDALLLTRVLRAGDVYYVPDIRGLTLLTGNAGGIEIAVDGVTLPPLGPIGAVRRQIALDPDYLLRNPSAGQ